MRTRIDHEKLDLKERIVSINRVAKVVKGGKRFKFSVLAVVGDGHGYVGYGLGKAREVPEAIKKAVNRAKKNLVLVPMRASTIPYEVTGEFGAAKILLKPASAGTGVIAGPAVRAIVESAGIHDILTKCMGRTTNPFNVVYATFNAIQALEDPEKILTLRKGK
ncbi:MAG TPA: 30S ribosomal protein S5 [Candidatus Goldiibacteriota bacterium]|nr:30S ribosomal protein S5 [Candidatus Goldiibacteriota bacterium]